MKNRFSFRGWSRSMFGWGARSAAGAGLGIALLAGNAVASPVYFLRNAVDFPTGPNYFDKGGTLTAATVDANETTFSTNPGNADDNHFAGIGSVLGTPFRLGVSASLSIGQATFSTPDPFLASSAAVAEEAGVTITGGSGTGFFIPTFRLQGTLNDSNPSVQEEVNLCVGLTSGCILNTVATSSGGLQTINTLFSPAIDSTTQFTFGTPVDLLMSISLTFERTNSQEALPGPTASGDFTNGLQLVSWKVVDANGNIIPGAQVNSQILDLASTPEPSTLGMGALALALAAAAMRIRRRRQWEMSPAYRGRS